MDRTDWSEECSMIERALRSPALSSPDSRLVVISCKDFASGGDYYLGANHNVSGIFSKLVLGHMSSHRMKLIHGTLAFRHGQLRQRR